MTLTGDDAGLLAELQRELSSRGISTAPRAACPTGRAHVGRQTSGIAVQIEDRFGRSSARTVDRTDAAAAVIASWTRDDLGAGLLVGHELEAPPPIAPVVTVAATAPPPGTAAARPVGVGVIAEGTIDSNRAFWFGARAEVCVRLGPVCVGPAVHVAEGMGRDRRREIAALAGLGIPVRLGALTVMPGAEAGIGRRWNSSGPQMFMQESSSTGARLGLRVSAGYQLAGLVSLQAAVALGWAPMADGTGMEQDDQVVAGEPRLFASAGVGLRVGGP